MSGSPKGKLHTQAGEEEINDERELYLRDGRRLVIGEQHGQQLVEIRSDSGMLEIRIKLTDQGPVLQVESATLSLKAVDAVEIESRRVEIKASEQVRLEGGEVRVSAEQDIKVDADGEVRVVGKMIYLN